MANSNVKIEVTEKNDNRYFMRARLIGAVTEDEASKIIPNKEVYDRVYRFETASIKEFMGVIDKNLEELRKSNTSKEDKYMRLVAALNEIKNNGSPIFMDVERKQLFISEPINFVTEISNYYNKVNMNTVGSSTIVLEKMEK